MTDLMRRPEGTVGRHLQAIRPPVRRAAAVCRPDRTGRIVAIAAPIGGSLALVHEAGAAPWSWPFPLVGLAVAALVGRRPR